MKCIEPGCSQPVAAPGEPIPGTGRTGSLYWCVRHEAERIKRIDASMRSLEDRLKRHQRRAKRRQPCPNDRRP